MSATLVFDVNEQDCREAFRHHERRLLRILPTRTAALAARGLFILACVATGLFAALLMNGYRGRTLAWLTCAAAAAVMSLYARQRLIRHGAMMLFAAGDSPLRGERVLALEDDGVRVRSRHGENFLQWAAIDAIEETEQVTLFYLGDVSVFLVPHRAFGSPEERGEFLSAARAHIDASAPPEQVHRAAATEETQSRDTGGADGGAAAALAVTGGWRDCAVNVLTGLKLAAFIRVRAEDIRTSWSQLIALIGLGLATTFLVEVATVGRNGELVIDGVPGALFHVPLALAAAWGLARLARRPEQTLALAIGLLALAIPIEAVDTLYQSAFAEGMGSSMGRLGLAADHIADIWLVVAASVTAARMFRMSLATRRLAVLIAAALLGLPLGAIPRDRTLWALPYGEEDLAGPAGGPVGIASEEAFYAQPRLLERELAALERGRKGVVDLYLVGVAGDAGQDVFMKEVNFVSALFRERFDTGGRTVRLINNPKTVDETPIASVTSLGLTLKRVARVMDRDEDILFLLLTSHGSKAHRLALEFPPMQLDALDPPRLRRVLDESGIKRRVVVVSACYAGGFLEALRDEHTLAIAAAATDRNSFGCSNDAELTYFGKAYFDQGLRETYSFVDAFESARARVAERERERNYERSDPQMFIGREIRAPLAELETRLKRRAVARGG